MKTMKISAITFLMAMGILMMNGCGSMDSGGTSSAPMTESATDLPEDNGAAESTGVIDGMMDDAKEGIDRMTDGKDGSSMND